MITSKLGQEAGDGGESQEGLVANVNVVRPSNWALAAKAVSTAPGQILLSVGAGAALVIGLIAAGIIRLSRKGR